MYGVCCWDQIRCQLWACSRFCGEAALHAAATVSGLSAGREEGGEERDIIYYPPTQDKMPGEYFRSGLDNMQDGREEQQEEGE